MKIHTVVSGETLYDIARLYGVNPAKIIENNTLYSPDRLCVGQKLLILTPTRTYTVRGGDRIDDIARRFSLSERSLLRRNPALSEKRGAYPMQVIALKYDPPQNRSILYNGYYYKGCPDSSLKFALSFSSHITICAYKATRGTLSSLFDDRGIIEKVTKHKAYPIMRIYIKEADLTSPERLDNLREEIIETAKRRGYSGICLALGSNSESEELNKLILEFKKELMAIDKVLFLECDGGFNKARELCDSVILRYEKCNSEEIPTFDSGERSFYTDDSEENDASVTFMDLSSFALTKSTSLTIREALADAYRVAGELKYDKDKMICFYNTKRYRHSSDDSLVAFPSLENIKAKLELVSQLGYIGISFDILRTPVEWLLMSLSLFDSLT